MPMRAASLSNNNLRPHQVYCKRLGHKSCEKLGCRDSVMITFGEAREEGPGQQRLPWLQRFWLADSLG